MANGLNGILSLDHCLPDPAQNFFLRKEYNQLFTSSKMGGGLLQLVAYGAQDVYLTGNPQITFWKVVYRRHTNFSMESIEQSFNGSPRFGSRVTAQISRNGDLIHRMWLQLELPALTTGEGITAAYGDYCGLAAIKYIELEIGGQKIDKHYGEWMHIWNTLSLGAGKKDGYETLTSGSMTPGATARTAYVPLEFWFCRNPGLALPLIALQYHDVKVNIEFESIVTVAGATAASTDTLDAKLWVDFVFLDTDERRRFSQMSHEYLIEQLQFTGDETTLNNVKLSFNHPCKELVWVLKDNAAAKLTYVAGELSTAKLQLNGHDRFSERNGAYFSLIQPFQHHENVPTGNNIYVYSFALKPEEHQPSGTLNMSRIDTATLKLTLTAVNTADYVKVFALSYNVLRILSGMGGLAYAN